MKKALIGLTIAGLLLTIIGPTTALAGEHKGPKHAEIVFAVVNKLLSKGDQAIVGIGRVIKAETYLKKLHQPDKALAELELLERELTDPELLTAVNALRMVIVKEACKEEPEKILTGIDGIIASAKERMAGH